MNSNYRPNGNPSVRRSVDGFVSAPNRSSTARQASSYQSNPQSHQKPAQPQYSQPQQYYQQQPPRRAYQSQPVQPTQPHSYNSHYSQQPAPRPPIPRLSQVISQQQSINQSSQFSSINSYQPQPSPAPQVENNTQSTTSLNSSIFPQNVKFYTNDYQTESSHQPIESEPIPQSAHNPIPQNFGYNNGYQPPTQQHAQRVNQSVIGSGSSISGAIISSSTPINIQSNQQFNNISNSTPSNYNEIPDQSGFGNGSLSSMQDMSQTQDNTQNSKFFPTTGSSLKIRPIPNTVKYNSWFSLEWIIGIFKSFFGNSYRD